MSPTPAKHRPGLDMGIAILWGVAIGRVLGAAFGEMGLGMTYGIAIGVAVGAIA